MPGEDEGSRQGAGDPDNPWDAFNDHLDGLIEESRAPLVARIEALEQALATTNQRLRQTENTFAARLNDLARELAGVEARGRTNDRV